MDGDFVCEILKWFFHPPILTAIIFSIFSVIFSKVLAQKICSLFNLEKEDEKKIRDLLRDIFVGAYVVFLICDFYIRISVYNCDVFE